MGIIIEGEILEGYFYSRLNRFIGEVYLDGEIIRAHIPNTGRMKELLSYGAKVLVKKANNIERKTKYDLIMVYYKDELVAIDSKFPNMLLYEGFCNREIGYFTDYYDVRKEVVYGNSRFDIGLTGKNTNTLIEAKCVTLVENKIAKFPDAPTTRGIKHIKELVKAKQAGFKTGIFFIIQRMDADIFTPNWEIDYGFSEELQKAYKTGVLIKAIKCKVNRHSVCLYEEVDVRL